MSKKLQVEKLSNYILKNSFSKDKTAICFIGYFKILEYRGKLLNNRIDMKDIYKHINNSNDIKYSSIEEFINKVDSYINSFNNPNWSMNFSTLIRDNFNKLGFDKVKQDGKENISNYNKIIELYNSIENFSIDDLIDLFESLTHPDKSFNDFFTPQSVSKFIANMAITKIDKKIINIYDPSCGIGRLLYYAFMNMKEKDDSLIINIFGVDLNSRFSIFTSSILELINYERVFIENKNTLKNEFIIPPIDICLSNPPFDKQNIELKFVEHILNLGCNAFVILPNSFTFSNNALKLRQNMIQKDLLKTIIQLPKNLFLNTSIETSIIEIDSNFEAKIMHFHKYFSDKNKYINMNSNKKAA